MMRSVLGSDQAMTSTHLYPDLDREGSGAESVAEDETVIALRRLSEARELARLAPVELAAVDDHTADGGSVAANPLRRAVDDDVRAVLDGADEVTADAEGVVDDERDAVVVGDLGDGGDIKDVELRVGDALDVDRLGLLVDRGNEVLRVRARHEPRLDPILLERDLELVVALQ